MIYNTIVLVYVNSFIDRRWRKLDIFSLEKTKALISSLDRRKTEKQFYHLKKNIFINLFSCFQKSVANSIFVTLSFSSFFNIPIYIQFSCSSYIFEINKEKRIKIKNVLNEDNLSSPYALVTCQNVCENEKWKVISSLKKKVDSRQENERKNNFTLSYIYIERAN